MPTKTKIIFIIVFIIVGAGMLGGYFYFTRTVVENADGTKTTSYKNFNPFGTGGKNETEVITENTTEENPQNQVGVNIASKFKKITEVPVAGAAFFKTVLTPKVEPVAKTVAEKEVKKTDIKVETTTPEIVLEKPTEQITRTLRYVERITGHVYQYNLDTKTSTRASNTTVPNIYEAVFNDTGDKALYRYSTDNKTITTYVVTTGKDTGDFLLSNISNLTLSKNKDKLFYLVRTRNGTVGYIKNFIETKGKVVFESPFSEWIAQYIDDTKIYLTTKASGKKEGHLYSLDIKTSTISKLYGNVLGLTTLSNSTGSYILISDSSSGRPVLKLLDVAKHSTTDLDLGGLAEKCIWGSDDINIYCAIPDTIQNGEYPDAWYQGSVSFNDRFVKIDTVTFEKTALVNTVEQQSFDAINLFLNDTQDTLFFTNKKDSMLWSLDLK